MVFNTGGLSMSGATKTYELPETWNGYPVVNGDDTDARFDDPRGGHVIGLKLKSPCWDKHNKATESGFAV